MKVFSMMQEIVEDPRFLYFTGTWFDRYELTLATRKALLGTLVVFFLVHKSLRKLPYDGTCWIIYLIKKYLLSLA